MSKRLRLERDYAEQLRQEAEEEDDKLKKLQERIFAPITWARLKFGFKIQDLREDRYADCIDMIINYHVKTEVLCRNTELIDDEVSLKYYLAAVQFFMKDSTSIIAINEENNETAGVLIIKKVNKQDYDHIFMRVSYNEGEARRKCMEIKNAMARKLDIFKTHDSVVLYYLLCIKEQYRHLGLGYQLMRIGLDVARSLHSSIVVGCFTDFKTQKCAKRLNFQIVMEISYTNWRDKNNELIFSDPGAGNYTCAMMIADVPAETIKDPAVIKVLTPAEMRVVVPPRTRLEKRRNIERIRNPQSALDGFIKIKNLQEFCKYY